MASSATTLTPNEVFATDFSILAREIAMDIFPLDQILQLHKISNEEWEKIQEHPKFVSTLHDMVAQWHAASNTKERVRVKAATGLEVVLEEYILDIKNPDIPLNHRVEAGKFLAKLGELDGAVLGGGQAGGGIQINISTGPTMAPLVLDITPNLPTNEDIPEWEEADDEVSA